MTSEQAVSTAEDKDTAGADGVRLHRVSNFVGMWERPDPPVEGGRPRSRDGTVLRPPQLPGAPDPVATNGLIGINSRDYKSLELFTKLATSELPEHAPDSHILSFLRVVLRQCRRYNGG